MTNTAITAISTTTTSSMQQQQQQQQRTGPLEGFNRLSDATLLYQPSQQQQPLSSSKEGLDNQTQQPSLVVLCTWLGADLRHVAKYTSTYQRLYPQSSILVVQSSLADVIYRSNKTQQKRLHLARDIILDHDSRRQQQQQQQQSSSSSSSQDNSDNNNSSIIFLHAFSNGGAQTAFNLVATLPPTQRRQIFQGLVLDSCPGRFELKGASKAMAISIPKTLPFSRILGPIIVNIVLFLMILLQAHGVQNTVTQARRYLNDDSLFGVEVPRLYVYSRADEMVGWKDVQDHAEDAREKGYKSVYALPFVDSKHCAHMMLDGERYWGAVTKLINSRSI